MKRSMLAILLFPSLISVAQKSPQQMILAEKNFAAYSVTHNTVDAFLKFMDTSAIMFKEGEAYKAFDEWTKKEKGPGILAWRPLYAEIAASGDFGYTCGPWTFQPKTVNDSVIRNGYFFTVWRKDPAGEWKFILDVGTDSGQLTDEMNVATITREKWGSTEAALRKAEEDFIKQYRANASMAFGVFASKAVLFASRNNPLQLVTNPSHLQQARMEFSCTGAGIAASGDLGYVYGTVTANGKKDAYLRIWRHEPGGWKIALQMTRL